MKRQFDYSISLRVTHPAYSAPEIARRLNMTPRFSWTVGEPRVSPKGTPLEGVRAESYCCFESVDGDDGEVAQCLQRAIDSLRPRKADLLVLRSSGGRISFFVFWYPNGDTGEVLSLDLLADMVNLGIELDLNVYDDRTSS